jgi:hypothetical protein
MNAQDIRNLQEAYLEVYDLDEAEVLAQKSGSPGTVQVKKTREGGFFGIGGREVNKPVPGTFKPKDVPSIDAARYNTGIDRKFGVDPSDTHSTAASSVQHRARSAGDSGYMKVKDPSSIPDTGRPNRPTPARSSDQNYAIRAGSDIVRMNRLAREQVDIYDIILSHLLDEGYAETPEAAEAIMVNMGEEWRESIMEMDDFAAGGGNAKIKETGMNKDQVIALGKKNLANVAKKQTPQQPQSSSQPSQAPASEKPKVAYGQLISKPGQPKRYADSGTITAKHKFHAYNDSQNRADTIASFYGLDRKDPATKSNLKKWADTNYRQNMAMDTNDPNYDPTKTSYPEFTPRKRTGREAWDKL